MVISFSYAQIEQFSKLWRAAGLISIKPSSKDYQVPYIYIQKVPGLNMGLLGLLWFFSMLKGNASKGGSKRLSIPFPTQYCNA